MTQKIFLPTKHICDEECGYTHMLGFRTGQNESYIDGKCGRYNKESDHESPSITCVSPDMWIDHESGKGQFLRPDEIVIKNADIKIEFDYPLSNPAFFSFHSDNGFTRRQLVNLIVDTYKKIYEEEDSSTVEVAPTTIEERMAKGGLINRNQTDGKYGIWGHDIEDLWLEGIHYDPIKKLVTLDIGS